MGGGVQQERSSLTQNQRLFFSYNNNNMMMMCNLNKTLFIQCLFSERGLRHRKLATRSSAANSPLKLTRKLFIKEEKVTGPTEPIRLKVIGERSNTQQPSAGVALKPGGRASQQVKSNKYKSSRKLRLTLPQ